MKERVCDWTRLDVDGLVGEFDDADLLNGGSAQRLLAAALEFVADVVDGEIAFAKLHDLRARGVFVGLGLWAVGDIAEEVAVHVVAEAPAKDAEGACLVAEASGRLGGGDPFEEIGAQRFVLALVWVAGLMEEAFLGRKRM